MDPNEISRYLLGKFWTGWRRWLAWSVCIAAILLLGLLQHATEAEFVFASLGLLPVLVIAWISGKLGGVFVALLASATWVVGDIAAERDFSASWIPWINALTRLVTYSLVALLAAQLRQQFEREHEHATRDALTGLANRRAFLEAGAAEVARSERYGHPVAVIFLDLDDFKQLNDTKGHAAGDRALRATATALTGALRTTDRVARLGGDEFAVVLPEIAYAAAQRAGDKLFAAVNAAMAGFPPARASVGVAWFGAADRSFEEMLKAADRLMYQAKDGGKGEVRSRRFDPVDG